MKIVAVEFKKKGKQYLFSNNNIELSVGNNVIVETEKGLQYGMVIGVDAKDNGEERSVVVRQATEEDREQNEINIIEANESVIKAQEIANNLGLEMKFINAVYTFDRKQMIFNFIADSRVDFRELAKSLANIYKTRIELRQVGIRDKAKEISGIGTCGRKLCCSSFLQDLDSVGIAMVKNQNLSLNPTKINGLCGRLLCCLKYEDEMYSDNKKDMPYVGQKIKYNDDEATVTMVDIPNKKYKVITANGERAEVVLKEKKEKNSKGERKYFNK